MIQSRLSERVLSQCGKEEKDPGPARGGSAQGVLNPKGGGHHGLSM